MAHVHSAAKAAGAAAKAGVQLMKDSLREGAGAVIEHGAGIDAMMNTPGKGSGIVAGAAVTATTQTGLSFMGKLSKHPLILFGVGVALGYLAHKYRKEIIESANRAAEKSKDFVLQQRENLEDLIAAGKEAADDAGQS